MLGRMATSPPLRRMTLESTSSTRRGTSWATSTRAARRALVADPAGHRGDAAGAQRRHSRWCTSSPVDRERGTWIVRGRFLLQRADAGHHRVRGHVPAVPGSAPGGDRGIRSWRWSPSRWRPESCSRVLDARRQAANSRETSAVYGRTLRTLPSGSRTSGATHRRGAGPGDLHPRGDH